MYCAVTLLCCVEHHDGCLESASPWRRAAIDSAIHQPTTDQPTPTNQPLHCSNCDIPKLDISPFKMPEVTISLWVKLSVRCVAICVHSFTPLAVSLLVACSVAVANDDVLFANLHRVPMLAC